jgi:uncharacterized protein (TIGR00297 family)
MGLDLTQIPTGTWAVTPLRLCFTLVVTAAFTGVGHLIRGVSRSGAIAGGLVCFVLFACAGPGAFTALFSVFAVTWLATRVGEARKQGLGTAERFEGRTASQVLANLGIAALCAGRFALGGNAVFLVAMAAALAEAAADTVSSECGQAFSDRAWLITTLEAVPAGTDGGITWIGSFYGALASAVVSAACRLVGLPTKWLWVPLVCGVLGMLGDSLLGAWFERRGRLGNDGVNFFSTGMAAAFAAGLFQLVR